MKTKLFLLLSILIAFQTITQASDLSSSEKQSKIKQLMEERRNRQKAVAASKKAAQAARAAERADVVACVKKQKELEAAERQAIQTANKARKRSQKFQHAQNEAQFPYTGKFGEPDTAHVHEQDAVALRLKGLGHSNVLEITAAPLTRPSAKGSSESVSLVAAVPRPVEEIFKTPLVSQERSRSMLPAIEMSSTESSRASSPEPRLSISPIHTDRLSPRVRVSSPEEEPRSPIKMPSPVPAARPITTLATSTETNCLVEPRQAAVISKKSSNKAPAAIPTDLKLQFSTGTPLMGGSQAERLNIASLFDQPRNQILPTNVNTPTVTRAHTPRDTQKLEEKIPTRSSLPVPVLKVTSMPKLRLSSKSTRITVAEDMDTEEVASIMGVPMDISVDIENVQKEKRKNSENNELQVAVQVSVKDQESNTQTDESSKAASALNRLNESETKKESIEVSEVKEPEVLAEEKTKIEVKPETEIETQASAVEPTGTTTKTQVQEVAAAEKKAAEEKSLEATMSAREEKENKLFSRIDQDTNFLLSGQATTQADQIVSQSAVEKILQAPVIEKDEKDDHVIIAKNMKILGLPLNSSEIDSSIFQIAEQTPKLEAAEEVATLTKLTTEIETLLAERKKVVEEQQRLESEEATRLGVELKSQELVTEQQKLEIAATELRTKRQKEAEELAAQEAAEEQQRLAEVAAQERQTLADEAAIKFVEQEQERQRLAEDAVEAQRLQAERKEVEEKRLQAEEEQIRQDVLAQVDAQILKQLEVEAERLQAKRQKEAEELAAQEVAEEQQRLAEVAAQERQTLADEAAIKFVEQEQERQRLAEDAVEAQRLQAERKEVEEKRLQAEEEQIRQDVLAQVDAQILKQLEVEAERLQAKRQKEAEELAAQEAAEEQQRLAEVAAQERQTLADEAAIKFVEQEQERQRLAEDAVEAQRLQAERKEVEEKRLQAEEEQMHQDALALADAERLKQLEAEANRLEVKRKAVEEIAAQESSIEQGKVEEVVVSETQTLADKVVTDSDFVSEPRKPTEMSLKVRPLKQRLLNEPVTEIESKVREVLKVGQPTIPSVDQEPVTEIECKVREAFKSEKQTPEEVVEEKRVQAEIDLQMHNALVADAEKLESGFGVEKIDPRDIEILPAAETGLAASTQSGLSSVEKGLVAGTQFAVSTVDQGHVLQSTQLVSELLPETSRAALEFNELKAEKLAAVKTPRLEAYEKLESGFGVEKIDPRDIEILPAAETGLAASTQSGLSSVDRKAELSELLMPVNAQDNNIALVPVDTNDIELMPVGANDIALIPISENDRTLIPVSGNDTALMSIGVKDSAFIPVAVATASRPLLLAAPKVLPYAAHAFRFTINPPAAIASALVLPLGTAAYFGYKKYVKNQNIKNTLEETERIQKQWKEEAALHPVVTLPNQFETDEVADELTSYSTQAIGTQSQSEQMQAHKEVVKVASLSEKETKRIQKQWKEEAALHPVVALPNQFETDEVADELTSYSTQVTGTQSQLEQNKPIQRVVVKSTVLPEVENAQTITDMQEQWKEEAVLHPVKKLLNQPEIDEVADELTSYSTQAIGTQLQPEQMQAHKDVVKVVSLSEKETVRMQEQWEKEAVLHPVVTLPNQPETGEVSDELTSYSTQAIGIESQLEQNQPNQHVVVKSTVLPEVENAQTITDMQNQWREEAVLHPVVALPNQPETGEVSDELTSYSTQAIGIESQLEQNKPIQRVVVKSTVLPEVENAQTITDMQEQWEKEAVLHPVVALPNQPETGEVSDELTSYSTQAIGIESQLEQNKPNQHVVVKSTVLPEVENAQEIARMQRQWQEAVANSTVTHDHQVGGIAYEQPVTVQIEPRAEQNAQEIARMQGQWQEAVEQQVKEMNNQPPSDSEVQSNVVPDNELLESTSLQDYKMSINTERLKAADCAKLHKAMILQLLAESSLENMDNDQEDANISKLLQLQFDEVSKKVLADQDRVDNANESENIQPSNHVNMQTAVVIGDLADKQAELDAAKIAQEKLAYDLIVNGFTVNNEGQPYPENMPTRWQRSKMYVALHPYKTGAIIALVTGLTTAGVVAYKKGYFEKLKDYWKNFKFKNPFAKAEAKPIKKKKNTKKRK